MNNASEQKQLSAFSISGLSITTNETTAMQDIGALWQRVGAAGLLNGDVAFAVYHHYKLRPGGYEVTVTVGTTSLNKPALDRVEIPAQHCWYRDTDGTLAQVQNAWSAVWSQWPTGGNRAFVADVERWQTDASGKPVRAEVYVGLRA